MQIDETIIDRLAVELLTRLDAAVANGLKVRSPDSILKLLKLTADAKESVRYLTKSDDYTMIEPESLEESLELQQTLIEGLKNDISIIQELERKQQQNNTGREGTAKTSTESRKNPKPKANNDVLAVPNWDA